MKLICRKCNIELEVNATSFEDIAVIQRMTCSGGGTHRLVGVNEGAITTKQTNGYLRSLKDGLTHARLIPIGKLTVLKMVCTLAGLTVLL